MNTNTRPSEIGDIAVVQDFVDGLKPSMLGYRVVIGPATELHRGVHGSLVEQPPQGVSYLRTGCDYHFLHRHKGTTRFNPFRDFSCSEIVEHKLGITQSCIVHSSRLPVMNPVPWLVDFDCMFNTLMYGQFFALGSEQNIRRGTISGDDCRLRQQIMLHHYLIDLCEAIVFRTEYRRSLVLSYIESENLLDKRRFDMLVGKTDVIYPTLASSGSAEKKPGKIRLVYMGRTKDDKGGDLALRVFYKLRHKFGDAIELTYVGETPSDADLNVSGLHISPILDREEYLALLANSHIFIAPTSYESYGMGFVEAASFGLAIVTTSGEGMEHIQEIFEADKNAYFVPNEYSVEQKIEKFVEKIRFLLENSERLREMGENNIRLLQYGRLALTRRDEKLLAYYGRMWHKHQFQAGKTVAHQVVELSRKHNFHTSHVSETFCWYGIQKITGGKNVRIRF